MTRPLAEASASEPASAGASSGIRATTRTCALVPVASTIWDATVRFHTSSYRRSSSPWRVCDASSGVRNTSPAGRIASCASCAFFTRRS